MVFRSWNKKRLFGIFLSLALPNHAIAGEIVTERYRYPADNTVSFSEGSTFLICESCPEPDSLILKPILPLVIRESGSLAVNPETLAQLNTPLQETQIPRPKKQQASQIQTKTQKFTIHFAFDSDKITSDSKKKLEEILKDIKTNTGTKTVTLLGYTCDIGTDIYNSNLSTQRALAVERYFQSKGFQHTGVSGKGSCCPISEQRSLNRRVEIIVKTGENK